MLSCMLYYSKEKKLSHQRKSVDAAAPVIALLMVCRVKWAAFVEALVVFFGIVAQDFCVGDGEVEVFVDEGGGFLEGEVGIAFAAAWAADVADAVEDAGGQFVNKAKGFGAEWGGFGQNGYGHAGADPGTASAPESAGATGYGTAAFFHFVQCGFEVKISPGVVAGGEQGHPHHDVVLRSVHVAKRQRHQFV